MSEFVDALHELAGANVLAAAVAPSSGPAAAVPMQVAIQGEHDALVVRASVDGPGCADARLLVLELDLADVVLHSMRGGRFEGAYPPEAFAPVVRTIHPRLTFPWAQQHARLAIGSRNGRSSDQDLPFFLLTDLAGEQGLWFAVGHSGDWQATLEKVTGTGRHRLTISGPGAGVELAEAESLALPAVYVGAFDGDGWHAIRRFVDAVAPGRQQPWVVYNSWFNEEARITHDRLLAHVPVAAEIGVEAFCVDAAWYETPTGDPTDFQTRGIGTWTLDLEKFPDGFEPLSQAVRDAGMAFGLWFEPERAHPDSWVATTHPEWLRSAPGQEFLLVDFGREGARAWALELMSSAIERWTLGWLKWDMNFHDFRPYWDGDERGELAHARGVWEVMDALRERFPDLVLEGCASGGNRIDVEMLRRCHTYWISDQTINPDIVRETVLNARRFLPARYCYLSVASNDGAPLEAHLDEWFVGNSHGVLGIMERLSEWSPDVRARAAAHVAAFKRIRHLLDAPATAFGGGPLLTDWRAVEYADPDADQAALVALRLGSPDERQTFEGRRTWDVDAPAWGAVISEYS